MYVTLCYANKNIDCIMNNNTVSSINPFIVSTGCFESPFLLVTIQQTACTLSYAFWM